MGNKEIQEQRIRGYFVQATREILKSEGLKSVSARNIAQKAGYSYATIYNYFRDVKDLIFECVKDFQDEAEGIIRSQLKNEPAGIARIKGITNAYTRYFVEYPGIFELFFIEKVYDLAGKQPTINLINSFLERLCEDDWNYLVTKKLIKETDATSAKAKLLITTTGILLLYLHRQYPMDYKEFTERSSWEINEILDGLSVKPSRNPKK
jgi:AcrR family transcriptional regulator